MANQQLPRASPYEGFSIARTVMADVVTYYLANGGPAVAREHLELLASEMIKLYDDGKDAYRDQMARIAAVEKQLQQEAEERMMEQQRTLMMAMMGTMKPSGTRKSPSQPKGELPPRLSTERAMQMWQRLQEAGFIDDSYQPVGLSRAEAAVLADVMVFLMSTENERLMGVKGKWRPFEILWHRRNMRADHYRALQEGKEPELRVKFTTLLKQ